MSHDTTISGGPGEVGQTNITELAPARLFRAHVEARADSYLERVRAQAERERAARQAVADAAVARAKARNYQTNLNCRDISDIRAWTEFDVADATVLASRVLKKNNPAVPALSYELFIVVSLYLAYSQDRYVDAAQPNRSDLNSLVHFAFDPGWASARQMLYSISNYFRDTPQVGTNAGQRAISFTQAAESVEDGILDALLIQYLISWRKALLAYEFENVWAKHGHKKIGRGQVVPLTPREPR